MTPGYAWNPPMTSMLKLHGNSLGNIMFDSSVWGFRSILGRRCGYRTVTHGSYEFGSRVMNILEEPV